MSKFYIKDTTAGRNIIFDTVPELVNYFNELIPRAFNITRKEYVQNLIDLGFGYDDAEGVMLTRALSENFDIGVIKNGAFVKTDIHIIDRFRKSEYGD